MEDVVVAAFSGSSGASLPDSVAMLAVMAAGSGSSYPAVRVSSTTVVDLPRLVPDGGRSADISSACCVVSSTNV